jgi:hypothetical protein
VTKQEAYAINIGDEVYYSGQKYRVTSVSVRGVAAPYFRLEGVTAGPTSYRLCARVDQKKGEN